MPEQVAEGRGQVGRSVQEALELRHRVEELAERCHRMYEEANALVERLRRVAAALPAEAGPADANVAGRETT